MTARDITRIVAETMNALQFVYDAPLEDFGAVTCDEIAEKIRAEHFPHVEQAGEAV